MSATQKTTEAIFFFALLLFPVLSRAEPAQVVLIRHAEKINDVDTGLSEKGIRRSQALVTFFKTNPTINRFGPPAALYAMDQRSATSSRRPILTLTPTAKELGLELRHPYTKKKTKELARELLSRKDIAGKTVIVCWEHSHLVDLVHDLGWKASHLSWPKGAYDRVWIVRFENGKPTAFEDITATGTGARYE